MKVDEVHFETEFPGLGTWPPIRAVAAARAGRRAHVRSGCRPCSASQYRTWTHFEWWVPIDADHHIYVQLADASRRPACGRLRFRLYYWLWVRWVFHGMFNDEDALMVDVMDAPPERLYRPDVSITEWRRLCERQERGTPVTVTRDLEVERARRARREAV